MVYNIVLEGKNYYFSFFKRFVFGEKVLGTPFQTPIATTGADHVADIINSRT